MVVASCAQDDNPEWPEDEEVLNCRSAQESTVLEDNDAEAANDETNEPEGSAIKTGD